MINFIAAKMTKKKFIDKINKDQNNLENRRNESNYCDNHYKKKNNSCPWRIKGKEIGGETRKEEEKGRKERERGVEKEKGKGKGTKKISRKGGKGKERSGKERSRKGRRRMKRRKRNRNREQR
jgi:hypothetical protein